MGRGVKEDWKRFAYFLEKRKNIIILLSTNGCTVVSYFPKAKLSDGVPLPKSSTLAQLLKAEYLRITSALVEPPQL